MKENGKRKYILHMEFSSGDVLDRECYVFEKYKRNSPSEGLKKEKNVMYIEPKEYGHITIYKVDNQMLAGIGYLHTDVTNFNMINNKSDRIYGTIELEGAYDHLLRKYEVENGTLKFKLSGSYFNLPDSVYTGTWTLKRK